MGYGRTLPNVYSMPASLQEESHAVWVFDSRMAQLCVEAEAHSDTINTLSIIEKEGLVLTGGADSLINIILPSQPKEDLVQSTVMVSRYDHYSYRILPMSDIQSNLSFSGRIVNLSCRLPSRRFSSLCSHRRQSMGAVQNEQF